MFEGILKDAAIVYGIIFAFIALLFLLQFFIAQVIIASVVLAATFVLILKSFISDDPYNTLPR